MIPARGPQGEPRALPVDLHAINTAASPAVRHDAMSWEGREGTEDTTGRGGNRDGRQPADSRSVAGFRRGPDGHRVAPADAPPAPAAPVTSTGAHALHMNHTQPACCRHSGRLSWLTWPAAVRGHGWVFRRGERGHGEVHGRAQRIHRPDRGPAAPGRRDRLGGPGSSGLSRVCGGRLRPRGPGYAWRRRRSAWTARSWTGRVHHGPFGQNLFIPNEAWRVQQDLSGAGSGRGSPGSP
jgi:hypothetical protein